MIRKHEFKFLNEHPQLKSNAIYAVNHSRKFDIPYVCEALNRHCYVLVGKQRLKSIDRMFFHINGVIWVDRKDRENRHKSSIVMEKMLNNGTNIVMFPETTWNIEPSLPMLPLRWGIIDIERNSHRPIVPVVLEYTDNCCYVSFAEPMYITESDDKKQKIDELRDTMATLRWEIWEQPPHVSRRDICGDEWEKEVKRILEEYPEYDYDYEQSCILRKNG